jgi:CubicO group peptidase (beta-lactamase class C family)
MAAFGFVFAIVGLVLLGAGVLARWGGRVADDGVGGRADGVRAALTSSGLDATWTQVVGVLLVVGGLLLADLRRIPDLVGMVVLTATLVTLVATWVRATVEGFRAQRLTASAVISGSAVVLAVAGGIVLMAVLGVDVASVLIVWGFVFALAGVAVTIVGLLWLIVALIRRKGRARAGRFILASVTVVVVGLAGVVVLAPRPPPVPESLADAAALDEYLQDLTDSDSPPSVSVVVVADGETVYERAFGLSDGVNGIAATPESVYHWYSTTKLATAIATLQLVERGLIDLDDPVEEHLDFFDPEYPSESSPRVTIADLLNHSAGFPNNVPAVIGWLRHDGEPALDQTEFLRDRLPSYDDLGFEPGSEGRYTNVGYYTLAAVIEQATGLPYEDYVVDNVLDPLGMVNTRFEYSDAMIANAAVGAHPMADFLTVFIPVMDPPWPTSYIRDYDAGWIWLERFLFEGNAPTGLIGPAPDKARLVAMVLNGGELDGTRVLSEESVDTLLWDRHVVAGSSPEMEEYSGYDDAVHGLGWFVATDGERTFHDHSGGGPGFASYMRLYADEGLGIVILANGTNLAYLELADAIADIDW